VLKLEKDLSRTLITGFHGIGLVGFIAVDFMVRKLKAEKIGWAYMDYMPAVVFIDGDKAEMPVEFYRKSISFMKVNVIMERETMNEFIGEVLGELRKKIKEIVVIGGLAVEGKDVYGVSNTYGRKIMEKMGLKKLKREITVFGPMASTLIYGEKNRIPVVCVLPAANPSIPDPEAASRAIRKVCEFYGLEIPTEDLEKEAKRIESRIKELEKKDEMAERMFV